MTGIRCQFCDFSIKFNELFLIQEDGLAKCKSCVDEDITKDSSQNLPFMSMAIQESFIVDYGRERKKVINRVRRLATYYSKHRKFQTKEEENGIRVWRVA